MVPESLGFAGEQELLARIRERATTRQVRAESDPGVVPRLGSSCAVPVWERTASLTRRAIPWLGWAAAAVLLGVVATKNIRPGGNRTLAVVPAEHGVVSAELADLRREVLSLQAEKEEASKKLKEAEARVRSTDTAFAQLFAQNQDQLLRRDALAAERDGLRAELGQRAGELEIARKRLNEEIGAKEATREQLADLNARLEKRRSEVYRLQELAGNAEAKLPLAASDLSSSEAKEILRARLAHCRCVRRRQRREIIQGLRQSLPCETQSVDLLRLRPVKGSTEPQGG